MYSLAKITQRKNENIRHIFYKGGYIEDVDVNQYKITFTDVNDKSDPKIFVTDMSNIVSFWKPSCVVCGEEIEKGQTMCPLCKLENERKNTRNRVNKFRNK